VWVAQFGQDALVRIDPQTNRVVATIPNEPGITGVSFGAGSVWACNHHDIYYGLAQLNLQTSQVQVQIAVGDRQSRSCSSVVALAQTIWTTSHTNNAQDTTLTRVDSATNK